MSSCRFDISSSLLKIDIANSACHAEQDQHVQLSVSASPSLAALMSAPPSVDAFGVLSATLNNFSTGSGSLLLTATDSLGASTSATVNVVVDSFFTSTYYSIKSQRHHLCQWAQQTNGVFSRVIKAAH